MEIEQETGFNDFMDAFDDSADYQTGEAEETAVEENAAEGTEEVAESETEGAEDGQDAGQETPGEGEQPGPEEKPQPQNDTFTLKVNKEEKTYSREEVISLAQKGADYDRVKEQLERSRQTTADLQIRLDDQNEALSELAKEAGMDVPALLDNLRIATLKKQGLSEDAAKERLLRLKAERENARLKEEKPAEQESAAETSQQRAKRDLEEFRRVYPDVQLTDELIGRLTPDVQGGASLLGAYRKYESAQKDARIAELQRQLEAEKQNKENRISSPGSQKDTGGKRTKTEYDDFMEAFR